MGKSKKLQYVDLRTRVPKEVAEVLRSKVSADYPYYRVVRDVVISAIKGVNTQALLREDTIVRLAAAAEATGYKSVDELIVDLSAAFLRVYRCNSGELAADESSPAVEIQTMFADMLTPRFDGLSVRHSVNLESYEQ